MDDTVAALYGAVYGWWVVHLILIWCEFKNEHALLCDDRIRTIHCGRHERNKMPTLGQTRTNHLSCFDWNGKSAILWARASCIWTGGRNWSIVGMDVRSRPRKNCRVHSDSCVLLDFIVMLFAIPHHKSQGSIKTSNTDEPPQLLQWLLLSSTAIPKLKRSKSWPWDNSWLLLSMPLFHLLAMGSNIDCSEPHRLNKHYFDLQQWLWATYRLNNCHWDVEDL